MPLAAWLPLMALSALLSAAWIALSQRPARETSSAATAFWVRLLAAAFLFPLLVVDLGWRMGGAVPTGAGFWGATAAAGLTEALSFLFILQGVRRDYYATSAMLNAAGVFTACLAPLLLPRQEFFAWSLVGGSALVLLGSFVFYRSSSLSWWGLAAAATTATRGMLNRWAIGQTKAMFVTVISFAISAAVLALLVRRLRNGQGAPAPAAAAAPPSATMVGTPVPAERAAGADGTPGTGAAGFGRLTGRLALMGLLSAASTATFYYPMERIGIVRLQPTFLAANVVCAFLFSFFALAEKRRAWPARLAGGLLVAAGGILVALAPGGK